MNILNNLNFFYSRCKTQFRYFVWVKLKRNYPANVEALKTIFIHIPKTAGTSLYELIGYTYIGHVTYRWYKDRNADKFNKYFKFAIVRNPWDRLVSTYFYLKKGGNNAMDEYWAKKHIYKYTDFDTFVKEWVTEKNVDSWMHFMPQHKYIYNERDELQVDYVARFENLSDDFKVIAKRLNSNKELPRVNVSKRTHYKDYYTEETKAIVAQVYSKDIELFDYTFE